MHAETVVFGAGHWHLPLYREAFAKHHAIIGAWDSDAEAAKQAAADLEPRCTTPWATASRRSRTWPTS